jgi:ceramide glucosyltransferase
MITQVLIGAAALALVTLVVIQLGTIVMVVHRLVVHRDHGGPPPPDGVSILRPVCGLENGIEITLASSFHIDHPHYELIFCVTDDDDPAIPLVRRLIAEHAQARARLLIGGEVGGPNPKLDNLKKGWDAAVYDWVVLSDCNMLIPEDYLDRLFVCWTERTAFVTSPVVGIDPQTGGAELEAAFLNTYQGRWQLVFDDLGIGLVHGKTVLMRRSDLAGEGGLAAFENEVADDCAATKVARRWGREVHVVRRPFVQPLGARGFAEVWRRQLRWARVRALAFPLSYTPEIVLGGLPAFVLACGLALAGVLPWTAVLALMVLWYVAEIPLAYALGAPPKWHSPLFWVVRDLLMPALWVGGCMIRSFDWRGNAIDAHPT